MDAGRLKMRKGLAGILIIAALIAWSYGEAFQPLSVVFWILSVLVWMKMDHGMGRASWRLGSKLPWASDVARVEDKLRPQHPFETDSADTRPPL